MQNPHDKHPVTLAFILFVVIFSVVSCSQKDKEIRMETFVNIYVDLAITKGMVWVNQLTDSVFITEKETILKKYKVTERQIRNTIASYDRDVHKWREFYEKVSRRLEELQKKEGN